MKIKHFSRLLTAGVILSSLAALSAPAFAVDLPFSAIAKIIRPLR